MNSKLRTLANEAISSQYFSFFVTVILFLVLYGVGIMTYKGFMRPQVFFNLFIDNSALIIVTIGITFTLLTGGIDLSVGAIVALSCMILASLLQNTVFAVPVAGGAVLALGICWGCAGVFDYSLQYAAVYRDFGRNVLLPRTYRGYFKGNDQYNQ